MHDNERVSVSVVCRALVPGSINAQLTTSTHQEDAVPLLLHNCELTFSYLLGFGIGLSVTSFSLTTLLSNGERRCCFCS